MPKYEVVSPVKVDGQVHKPGVELLELTESQAAPAIKSGSLKLVVEVSSDPSKGLNAKEKIGAVLVAATIEDLDKLAEGEERKSVLEAIDKRRAELAG